MKTVQEAMLLYAVTDRSWVGKQTLMEQVECALQGGVTCVQLREKQLDRENFLAEAVEMRDLCHRYGVPLLINDNVEIARQSGADGVHLGQSDMDPAEARRILGPDKIIGVSARTVEQARKAQAAGASYLGSGAVFGTSTKADARPLDHSVLKEICRSVTIPVVAIGGITEDNLPRLAGTGVDGVAVVSAIFRAPDIRTRCEQLCALSRGMTGDPAHGPGTTSGMSEEHPMKTALSIAGSDCSGGAGIQADLKTMTMNGVFAMSAITALTAQNTTGVRSILEVSPDFLKDQIDAVFEDIRPDAVKIGMVASQALIETIAERLQYYRVEHLVVDPVMVATSGARLISEDAVETLKTKLLPLATVVTPNIPEAEILSGRTIQTGEDMEQAARSIGEQYCCAVLCKGGHSIHDADDLLYDRGEMHWFRGRRIQNPNTHGTGCTLSSAIAANLAKGYDLARSVERAKAYISGALGAMLDLGSGSGPMNHAFNLTGEFR